MDQHAIHLVYGSDDNYWLYTAISAASAAFGTSSALVVHLFDLGIADKHYAAYADIVRRANAQVELVRHRLSPQDYEKFGAWKGSLVTYSRMFVAELLPDLDWAIYVDGDTLWLGDIAKLWQLRDESKLVLASIDPPTPDGSPSKQIDWYAERGLKVDYDGYLCMGLMMANLKRMREENVPQQCRDFLQMYPNPKIVDQTVLNYVCNGKTKALPVNWGVFSAWHVGVDLSDCGCIHYVTDVPWSRRKPNQLMSDVVMLWYAFADNVLGLEMKRKCLSRLDYCWRRGMYQILHRCQWLVRMNSFVRSKLRNTAGMESGVYLHWLDSFKGGPR